MTLDKAFEIYSMTQSHVNFELDKNQMDPNATWNEDDDMEELARNIAVMREATLDFFSTLSEEIKWDLIDAAGGVKRVQRAFSLRNKIKAFISSILEPEEFLNITASIALSYIVQE